MDTPTLICIGVIALIVGAAVFYLFGTQSGDIWSREDQKRSGITPLNETIAKAADDRSGDTSGSW